MLNRSLPATPAGRSPVVPLESFTAPVELKLESAEAVILVKAPVLAVVAPTVPFMLPAIAEVNVLTPAIV